MSDHDTNLAAAFDGQAAQFERAPVQSDPARIARFLQMASLLAGGRVLDAGCGPGLVSEALLQAGHRVHGVDLSAEMIARARQRCAAYGERASFCITRWTPSPFSVGSWSCCDPEASRRCAITPPTRTTPAPPGISASSAAAIAPIPAMRRPANSSIGWPPPV
jgi:SAM-dependent methyltransferase